MFRILFCVNFALIFSCAFQELKTSENLNEWTESKLSFKKILLVRNYNATDFFEERFNQFATVRRSEERLGEKLQELKIANAIEVVSPGPFRTQSLEDLTMLARRLGCDAYLSYSETRNVQPSFNILGLTYATLVGLFIFPGSNLQIGVSWDVNIVRVTDGQALFRGQWSGMSPLFHFAAGRYAQIYSKAYRMATELAVDSAFIAKSSAL